VPNSYLQQGILSVTSSLAQFHRRNDAGLFKFLHPATGRFIPAQSSLPAKWPLSSHSLAILSKPFQTFVSMTRKVLIAVPNCFAHNIACSGHFEHSPSSGIDGLSNPTNNCCLSNNIKWRFGDPQRTAQERRQLLLPKHTTCSITVSTQAEATQKAGGIL
jgi:hypothetical protein